MSEALVQRTSEGDKEINENGRKTQVAVGLMESGGGADSRRGRALSSRWQPLFRQRKGVQPEMTGREGSRSQDSGAQVGVRSTEWVRHLFLQNEKEEGEGEYGYRAN